MGSNYQNFVDFNFRELRLPKGYQPVPGRAFLGVEVAGYSHEQHYAGDGWKFHLSVDPQDVPRAFDLLLPVIERHGVQAFKVTTPEYSEKFNDPNNAQRGKQFTLYGARNDANFRWDDVMRDIEVEFAREGIRPSHAIHGDRMVPGSQYAGYRNELNHGALSRYANEDGYLGADEIREAVRNGEVRPGWEHNPTGQPDRLQDIDFSRDPVVQQARASAGAAMRTPEPSPSRTSNAAHSVRADLQDALGRENIRGVERVEGGYKVEVPPTYSRGEFSRVGIDAQGLRRQVEGDRHYVILPEDRLPEAMARDARVFDALDRAGISDAASSAHRTGSRAQTTGYVIDVPETYSRSELNRAGIDTSQLRREDLGNGTHRITIAPAATQAIHAAARSSDQSWGGALGQPQASQNGYGVQASAEPDWAASRASAPAAPLLATNDAGQMQQMQRLSQARVGLQQHSASISRVRELEMESPLSRDVGYNMEATQGYQQWIQMYQGLEADRLTPQQNASMDRMSSILQGIRDDYNGLGSTRDTFGDYVAPERVQGFVADRMQELATTGETYMRGGHDKHFNVVRIRALEGGGYSYTVYDAGHETAVVDRDQFGKLRVNAVVERRLLPGANPADLIYSNVSKMLSSSTSGTYELAKDAIDTRLETTPMRVVEDMAQTRNNCTTMGQRILFQDVTGDQALTGRLYAFMTDPNLTPQGVDRLLYDKAMAVQAGNPGAVRALNLSDDGWQPYKSNAGGIGYRYETPFSQDGQRTPEMEAFQRQLAQNGVEVQWGEKGGKVYAYVLKDVNPDSYQRLQGQLGITAAPELGNRMGFNLHADPATHTMDQFMRFGLGDENVLNIRRIDGATQVQVPATLSRSKLADMGIDISGVSRQPDGDFTHTITIPDERLPGQMQQAMQHYARTSQSSALGQAAPQAPEPAGPTRPFDTPLDIVADEARYNREIDVARAEADADKTWNRVGITEPEEVRAIRSGMERARNGGGAPMPEVEPTVVRAPESVPFTPEQWGQYARGEIDHAGQPLGGRASTDLSATQAAPQDTSAHYRVGDSEIHSYQTTGTEQDANGPRRANLGQADTFRVMTSAQQLDAAALARTMDALSDASQSYLDANHRGPAMDAPSTTGQITAISQPNNQPGQFEINTSRRGDSHSSVIVIDAQNNVRFTDLIRDVELSASNPQGEFGPYAVRGENTISTHSLTLAPGERAVVLTATDGLTDAYIGKKGQMQQDIQAYLHSNPEAPDVAKFLTERATALGSSDNITILSTTLDHTTQLRGQSTVMAVFDGIGHDDDRLSRHLAQQLEQHLPEGRIAERVSTRAVPHVATRELTEFAPTQTYNQRYVLNDRGEMIDTHARARAQERVEIDHRDALAEEAKRRGVTPGSDDWGREPGATERAPRTPTTEISTDGAARVIDTATPDRSRAGPTMSAANDGASTRPMTVGTAALQLEPEPARAPAQPEPRRVETRAPAAAAAPASNDNGRTVPEPAAPHADAPEPEARPAAPHRPGIRERLDHVGSRVGVATIAVQSAAAVKAYREGDMDTARQHAQGAVVSTAFEAGFSQGGMRVGTEVAVATVERVGLRAAATGIKAAGAKIPVAGAFIGAAFGIGETGYEAYKALNGESNWKKVGGTFLSGVAGTVGGIIGFGAGEALQEGVHYGTAAAFGKENAARHSATGELIIMGSELAGVGGNPQGDWRTRQAQAAQERQRAAAAQSGQAHSSFSGRAGAQHLNQELNEIVGQFARTNWGQHIGNGDRNVTAQELRQEMQQHGITVAEIDRNRDGNITGKEMTDALQAHGVQRDRGSPQAAARPAQGDWRAEQARAARERQAAAAEAPHAHSSFSGRAGAQHLNSELKDLEGQMARTNWGRFIGNGDANVTVAEMRATMQKHGITVAEIDRNGDGNISGREFTNALQAHNVQKQPVRGGGGNGR